MKSPCCGAVVNQLDCEECFGWPSSFEYCDKMCEECDGSGLSSDKFECSECFEHYEECDLIQE